MTSPARIGIVVTDTYSPVDPDHDTAPLVAALRERGADAQPVVWHDARVDLTAFDLLVIRSPWDYPDRPGQFHAWLDRAGAATHVVNAPATMRWNLDKRYLADLAQAGIRIVPTAYTRTSDEARAALSAHERVVVKPAVSAGARDTGLYDMSDPAGGADALALAERIIAGDGVAMIQPEIAELSAGREKALYLIDGAFTHAIAKGALLADGGGFLGGEYVEHPELVDATDAEIAFAKDVLRAVREVTSDETPLYARVDLVDSAAHGLCLLEVELVEPALNLHVAAQVTAVVADAILRAAA
ncbi:ATP-grasp domain-containing protein [Microbacterium sp.]|uniref:ATP-grasp domain-containing protein n=1 Tax=Microbacterium sp. TaxID=51671 RepID=UPI0039E5451D